MDDSNQNQNKGDNQVHQPLNPIGTLQKEVEAAPVRDYVASSETMPKIEKEVLDAGVKEIDQAPRLTQEHFKVGITHSAESTPVRESTMQIKLPMTESEALQQAKGNTNDATTWLASFILRLLKKMRVSGNP